MNVNKTSGRISNFLLRVGLGRFFSSISVSNFFISVFFSTIVSNQLKNLLSGRIKKRNLGLYLICLLILFFSSLLIAELLFPGGYSARHYFISDHGSPHLNPYGAFFFIIGVGITGILLIPYFIFIFRQTWHTMKIPSIIALIGGITGSIGLSIVGFFPKGGSVNYIHDLGTDFAWYGFLLTMLTTSGILCIGILKRNGWPNVFGFILLEGLVFISGIHVFLLDIPTFRQWTAFATVFLWLVGIYFILPSEVRKQNRLKSEK